MTITSPPPLVKVRGLSKSYGSIIAVDDVDMHISAGEIVGLVGKNGAGKSSLIKVITGAVQPDSGTISMGGGEVTFHGPSDARRHGIAFVHQELNLIESSSVAENIVLGAGYPRRAGRLVDWRALHRRARDLMDAVDLGQVDPRQRVSSLGPVQKRQVMIAAALWHRRSVLILDEPTASLSEHEIVILHGIVRRLRDAGTGVLYVTHRLAEVLSLTNRVIVMRDGAVISEANTGSIDKRALVTMISGKVAIDGQHMRAYRETATDVVLEVNGLGSVRSPGPHSFRVAAGEILGIAGLVGAGRSELLHAIYGSDRRVSGTIRVGGHPVSASSPRAALRAGMALLSEDRRHAGLITDFSVSRNVSFARLDAVRRTRIVPVPSPRRERELANTTVDSLMIKARHVDDGVMTLSGGNQQKVLLGRWLATRPRVLLLDEPTLGVDVDAKAEIYSMLRRWADEGLALVVVSSEFSELELLCDRALVLRDGTVVDEVRGSDLTEIELLHRCFDSHRG
jgi:ABC-type sugar transport system ATPase subunit